MTDKTDRNDRDANAPKVVANPKTASPDPAFMDVGAGTAAAQAARPQYQADYADGGWTPVLEAATGATAGSPGVFTPPGCATPADLAALSTVVASPATLWTVGQYVTTADAADAYWSGTVWLAGRAPVLARSERSE